jgi:hypothetical protein
LISLVELGLAFMAADLLNLLIIGEPLKSSEGNSAFVGDYSILL